MKKIIALILCLVLILTLFVPTVSYAEPMTISQIAAIAYAIGSELTLDWTMVNQTSSSINDYLSDKINSWMGGLTIEEVFGAEIARNLMGKLYVPALMYNAIKSFLKDFSEENQLVSTNKDMAMQVGDYIVQAVGTEGTTTTRAKWTIYRISTGILTTQYSGSRNANLDLTNDGLEYDSSYGIMGKYSYIYVSSRTHQRVQLVSGVSGTRKTIGAAIETPIDETELETDEAWSGTINGQTYPNMSLDEILEIVLGHVLDDTISVEGEVISPIVPPTPAPEPPVPYPPAESELDGINTNIEQLNDMLGSAYNIDQGINDLIESGTGTVEGLNDLIGQGETVIEGIDNLIDSLEGVESAAGDIAEAMEAVEVLTGSIDSALDIINASDAANYKFDLKTLFPFCIPFDIVRIIKAFDQATGTPTAPHVQIPMDFGDVIGVYTWDFDFAIFNPVAALLRQVELIVFAIGLAIATNKLIRW